jgi:urea carboxylase
LEENAEELPAVPASPILHEIPESPGQVAVTYRQAGDKYILVEYGPLVLDLNLRFRAHALMEQLKSKSVAGCYRISAGNAIAPNSL